MAHESYQKLKDRFHLLANLEGAKSILYVDGVTTMKPGSQNDRTEQAMAIASAAHTLLIDPVIEEWLNDATADEQNLSIDDRRNLNLMKRKWAAQSALPEELVRAIARQEQDGEHMHTTHRDSGNWDAMKPIYESSFAIAREKGNILKDLLGFETPYEALLDEFSPGLKLSTVNSEFAKLQATLPSIIAERLEIQAKQNPATPIGELAIEHQSTIGTIISNAMGFDTTRGILYAGNNHPFCGGTADDARMTTRYIPHNFTKGLYSTIHETGHSLYEQGRPQAWRYQPAGNALGMDIHESQSMIWEYQTAQTPEFFDYLSDLVSAEIPTANHAAFTSDNLGKLIHYVTPSLIRVAADELTYPSHVIARFNIERDIVNGAMSVDDLPEAWNAAMKTLLGVTPSDPSNGHMQDVHWPAGLVGYFPAYTLGAMGAAQFFHAAQTAHPTLRDEFRKGQFGTLKTWLNKNVHGHGSLLTPEELFKSATGEALNADYYLNHLSNRYLGRNYRP